MNQIKFSHVYPKIWGQKTARLIRVEVIDGKALDKDLIEYDTKYISGDGAKNYYELPKSLLLQLVFLGDKRIPFCTLRRHTVEKERYYDKLVGQEFEVVINEE